MKWKELDLSNASYDIYDWRLIKTDIECPKCGCLLYRRLDTVLTSMPPQYKYECSRCGWIGFSNVKR